MAKALTERSKSSRGAAPRADASAAGARRQRLWRDLALIVIAPLLLYLLASLISHSPQDLGWSARSTHRALKVARTIADLAGATTTQVSHVAEAVQYRRVLRSPV